MGGGIFIFVFIFVVMDAAYPDLPYVAPILLYFKLGKVMYWGGHIIPLKNQPFPFMFPNTTTKRKGVRDLCKK